MTRPSCTLVSFVVYVFHETDFCHFHPVPFTNRRIPSFKCTTLKFISRPMDLPLSLR